MNRHPLLIALAIAAAVSAIAASGCKRAPEAPAQVAAAPAEAIDTAVVAEANHATPDSAAPDFDAKAFAGLYAATLPCADCPGIDTSISFAAEGTYSMSETYQDSADSSFVTKGTWSVREDGKTVVLDPEDKQERDRWFQVVSATELRALDLEGKPIESTLDYSLRRK